MWIFYDCSIMRYIWNIYEPSDPQDVNEEDPYDVFVYSQTMEEVPHTGDLIYLEGRNHRVLACTVDWNMTEAQVRNDVTYYKVCVVD